MIEGREQFLQMVDTFGAVIDRRHQAMLDYLGEPHRSTTSPSIGSLPTPRPALLRRSVEHRSANLHMERMLRRGEAVEVDSGRFRRVRHRGAASRLPDITMST